MQVSEHVLSGSDPPNKVMVAELDTSVAYNLKLSTNARRMKLCISDMRWRIMARAMIDGVAWCSAMMARHGWPNFVANHMAHCVARAPQ